jgi:probable phosphoglycerate mutase
LTELGTLQAQALVAALEDQPVEAIYASSLTRTQLTAAPLAAERDLPVVVRDGLREVTAGDFEMCSDVDSVEAYLSTVFAWSAGDLARQMPGGETGLETLGRYDAVVADASEAASAVLVSHGAAIRMWVAARASNVDVAFARTHALDNTGFIVAEGDPANGWRVLSWTGALIEDATGGPGGEPLPIPH